MTIPYTLLVVGAGAVLLGAVGGTMGAFALLRRQSLLGDALAHAALPGVCLAYLLTGTRDPTVLFLGALGAGLVGAGLILLVIRGSRVKEDAAMGIVLSVFFGVGIVLLTYIQRQPGGMKSGLDRFLFGQAASLLRGDVERLALVGGGILFLVLLAFKEFKLAVFDRDFAAGLGFPARFLEGALTVLLVLVVVVGLQTVGVVLIVAALVTPAAAARQWTDRFGPMAGLAGLLGGLAGGIGAVASALTPRLPTGPAIVVTASVFFLGSLLFAPRRGLVRTWRAAGRLRRRIREENLLKDLYGLAEWSGDWDGFVPYGVLMGLRGRGARALVRTLRPLARRGLVERRGDAVRLTAAGRQAAARVVRGHRLWETYLARRLELPADHVHRDAEVMEHVLDARWVADLDTLLGRPAVDPHGRPIPREETS